jgi:hypothetical protein
MNASCDVCYLAGCDEFLNRRVVDAELLECATIPRIDPRVADVKSHPVARCVLVIRHKNNTGQRRARHRRPRYFRRKRDNGIVRGADRRKNVIRSGQLLGNQVLAQNGGCGLARQVTAGVPAHAVGDDEKRKFGNVAVFVD